MGNQCTNQTIQWTVFPSRGGVEEPNNNIRSRIHAHLVHLDERLSEFHKDVKDPAYSIQVPFGFLLFIKEEFFLHPLFIHPKQLNHSEFMACDKWLHAVEYVLLSHVVRMNTSGIYDSFQRLKHFWMIKYYA